MPDAIVPGRFLWHELMTPDPDGAVAFYSKVIGWKVEAYAGDPSYRMWMVGRTPMGGLMRLPEEARRMGAPPHWLTYISTPDVDATARQAQGLGARTYVAPQDIPNVGRFAVLADPQGAMFAVYCPTMVPRDPPQRGARGDFSWHELITTDWRAAWAFYQALFGWEQTEAMDMGPGGTYQMFGRRGQTVGGMYSAPPGSASPPSWLAYVHVGSADRAADQAARLGGSIVSAPMAVPGGDRVARLRDPQGGVFAVHSTAPARKSARPKKARKTKKTKRKPARTARRRTAAAKRRPTARRPRRRTAKRKPRARPRRRG